MEGGLFLSGLIGLFGGFIFLRWLHAMEESS
jgi:hypothetical protein